MSRRLRAKRRKGSSLPLKPGDRIYPTSQSPWEQEFTPTHPVTLKRVFYLEGYYFVTTRENERKDYFLNRFSRKLDGIPLTREDIHQSAIVKYENACR